jgi:hypothetical protein
MENLKSYKKFILNEGLLDKLLGREESSPSVLPVESQSKEVSTQSLVDELAKKINSSDDSPVYVFTQIETDQDLYVSAELFSEAKRIGFEIEKRGTMYTTGGRYSYSVLDCSLMQSFDAERIKYDLSGILKKNGSEGIKTIIEFANISSLVKEQISEICDFISSRQISDYMLKGGDFFIMSDNSNNQKGGKDFSQNITSFFPKIQIEKFKHIFSPKDENPA